MKTLFPGYSDYAWSPQTAVRTKKLQAARVRLSSDSRLLPDDFTHALSSSTDWPARQRRQSRRRIQSFRPPHLRLDHLLFYWDSPAGAPAKGTAAINQYAQNR